MGNSGNLGVKGLNLYPGSVPWANNSLSKFQFPEL